MKIQKIFLKTWGLDAETIIQDALLNTYFMSPPRIFLWERLLFEPDYEGDNFMNLAGEFQINKSAVGNCLSTIKRTNGAVAAFLPGVARRLGELLDADFYLVFTSVHEVMIHHAETVEIQDLVGVLRDTIQEATPEEDYLTSKVYYYSRDTEDFTCILN